MLRIVQDLKLAEVYPLFPPLWYSDSRQGLPRRGGGLVPSLLVLVHFDRYNHRDYTCYGADDCSDHCYFCNHSRYLISDYVIEHTLDIVKHFL